jgi:hypothetical protein
VGSALVLAVVLTSLLAMVGVLFVMSRRVDMIATSAIADHRDLNLAVDSVVAKINEELVRDVDFLGEEYYDYPDHNLHPGLDLTGETADDVMIEPGPDGELGTMDDLPHFGFADNIWLASLEPEMVDVGADLGAPGIDVGVGFRHITDLYGRLAYLFQDSYDYAAGVPEYRDDDGDRISFRKLRATIIGVGLPIAGQGDKADADGDGVADSRWVILPDMTSGKGWPIYAAIRIVDNGGMLNINTAWKFDPTEEPLLRERVNGNSLMQINLAELSLRGANGGLGVAAAKLQNLRVGVGDPLLYERNVVWSYNGPVGPYSPFDVSDEIELRNRFLVNLGDMDVRIENLWTNAFMNPNRRSPVEADTSEEFKDWVNRAQPYDYDTAVLSPIYSYRHLATTHNMDRIVRPDGGRMIDVNSPPDLTDPNFITSLQEAIFNALIPDPNAALMSAQITANLIDYIDSDSQVKELDSGGVKYYGFERPCVYISELAHKYSAEDANTTCDSYAIELHNPYPDDGAPVGWRVVVHAVPERVVGEPNVIFDIDWSGTGSFHVIERYTDTQCSFGACGGCDPCDPNCDPNEPNEPNDPNDPNDANDGFGCNAGTTNKAIFDANDIIELQRPVGADWVVADAVKVPAWLVLPVAGQRSYQRDITRHKCIRRLWAAATEPTATLGGLNTYPADPDVETEVIQAYPANKGFTNVGEIGMVFARPAYYRPLPGANPMKPEDSGAIGYTADAKTADKVCVNLADPNFQQLTNYLTVFDPSGDLIDNDGDGLVDRADTSRPEWKIAGRINVNTAPWYVIAQLPWMTPEIAQAVVAYRDKTVAVAGVVDYFEYPPDPPLVGRAKGMWDLADPTPPIVVREEPGFASIAELANVTHDLAEKGAPTYYRDTYDIRALGRDLDPVDPNKEFDQVGFPDLSTDSATEPDGAANDLEERDLILARISNLATVRSDVFTAYILVRIGTNGPQKRVIAILDRSDVYPDPAAPGRLTGKVKVRALHPVPDPR